jgi:hypothetical protein
MPLSASVRYIGHATFALALGVLTATIAPRITSPWPLEWMEGASLHHALRLLHGQPLYGPPSAEFIPFIYPPLAYLPIAASISLLGPSLWVGRLVSVLALAGSLACVFVTLRRSTGSAAIGCWGAGVYGLGFGYTGAFVDLVRVDSVFMLLVLLGVERLSANKPHAGLAWLVLSCFAKQHGLVFLGAAGVALLVIEGRRSIWALSAAGAALALGVVALQASTGGNFLKYTWTVPGGHGLVWQLVLSYFSVDVLLYLPALAAFTVLGGRPRTLGGGHAALGWAVILAGLAASALGRAHPGGADNVRLPGFAVLVLASGAAFPELLRTTRTRFGRFACTAALALQPLLLLQLPAAHAPTPRTASAFEALRSALERCANGHATEAVALDHALFTGRPFLHTMALSDLRMGTDEALAAAGTRALVTALERSDAPPSIAVSSTFPELTRVLAERYEPCESLPALQLPTGFEVGPTTVHRRRHIFAE